MYSKILSLTEMISVDILKFFMWPVCSILPLGIQNLLKFKSIFPKYGLIIITENENAFKNNFKLIVQVTKFTHPQINHYQTV